MKIEEIMVLAMETMRYPDQEVNYLEHIGFVENAQAAIAAIGQAGYVIVPVEPTKQTLEKMRDAHPMAASVYRDSYDMFKIYASMIQQAKEDM